MTGKPLAYKEIQTLQILRASGLTYNAIAEQINRSPKTVKKATLDPMIASGIKEIQEELSDAYEGLARRMIDSISDEDILKINAYQRCISSGVATDKMRLLRNESTENISMQTISATAENLKSRREALEKRIKQVKREDEVYEDEAHNTK
mgnify:CR=1 FL=1|jgi:hypothetical protein